MTEISMALAFPTRTVNWRVASQICLSPALMNPSKIVVPSAAARTQERSLAVAITRKRDDVVVVGGAGLAAGGDAGDALGCSDGPARWPGVPCAGAAVTAGDWPGTGAWAGAVARTVGDARSGGTEGDSINWRIWP